MNKISAFLTHLAISLVVVSIVFLVIKFQLYPDYYFALQGIIELVILLFVVDVIFGPLLTLLVYKKGKKSLKFDLSFIAFFQIVALMYGTYIIYQERPISALLVDNSFEIQTAAGYDFATVDESKVDTNFFSTPRFHVLNPSEDIRIAMTIFSFTGEGSRDYLYNTDFYTELDEQKERIQVAALTPEHLDKTYPDLAYDTDKYFYVRVIGKVGFALALLDKKSYELVDVIALTDFDMNKL